MALRVNLILSYGFANGINNKRREVRRGGGGYVAVCYCSPLKVLLDQVE